MTDEELKGLELAFAVGHAREIIDADGTTDYGEFKLFGAIFPRQLLRDHGFIDADAAFTPALDVARERALAVLPAALGKAEKLDLLTLLWGTGVADDDLDKREVQVIRKAADELGVTFEELLAQVANLD
jgi:uncharacterized tellurite resistance protein B-like protein